MRGRDTPPRPLRRMAEELAIRERQRREAREIERATVTEPTLHERGTPAPRMVNPSQWLAADWVWDPAPPEDRYLIPEQNVAPPHEEVDPPLDNPWGGMIAAEAGERMQDFAEAVRRTGGVYVIRITVTDGETTTYVMDPTGRPIDGLLETVEIPIYPGSDLNPIVYPDASFNYYGSDPNQSGHGMDGGTPMTFWKSYWEQMRRWTG